jgi:uroporphyrinogen-III synthase
MLAPRTIVVTRPEEPGRALTAALNERGAGALWLPAFDLVAPSDPEVARRTLREVGRYDLAVFVSPAAVQATAALREGAWPEDTTIAAVGPATRRAVTELLRPSARVRVVAPDGGGEEGGSEALWHALEAAGVRPREVLLLRAASGREWLTERFTQDGARVDALAVYERRRHRLSWDEQAHWAACAAHGFDSVFTSSEAVDAVEGMLAGIAGAWEALKCGTAVASHPRIATRLQQAGFARVVVAAAQADAIIAVLAADSGA